MAYSYNVTRNIKIPTKFDTADKGKDIVKKFAFALMDDLLVLKCTGKKFNINDLSRKEIMVLGGAFDKFYKIILLKYKDKVLDEIRKLGATDGETSACWK